MGYPDQAQERSHAALTLTQEHAHAYSLVHTLSSTTQFYQFLRQVPETQAHLEAQITLATEQGFAQYAAQGMIIQGWTLVETGQAQEGIAQMRQGLVAYQATGAEAGLPYVLTLLAEAYGKVGETEEGLHLAADALSLVQRHAERWWEAEVYRCQGTLYCMQSGEYQAEAEACFQQALAVARRQHAKSLELRSAMSLGRLWQQQGKGDETCALLAPVYNWFTEGFATADLQAAKALLETLGG